MLNRLEKQLFILLTCFIALTACMRDRITVPPVTENRTGTYSYGKFIWHDLLTDDLAAARNFYQSLFAWEFKGRGGDDAPYLTAYNGDIPVCGIVKSDRLESDRSESRWIGYISVPDVQQSAGTILRMQGIIFVLPRELSDRGIVALAGDPWGANFGLIKTWDGDPEEKEPQINDWLWDELLTASPDSMAGFYQEVFKYTRDVNKIESENKYTILKSKSGVCAGISHLTNINMSPFWLSYIRVENINTIMDRSQTLGGKIIHVSKAGPDKTSAAIIADPTGAIFGVQEWP